MDFSIFCLRWARVSRRASSVEIGSEDAVSAGVLGRDLVRTEEERGGWLCSRGMEEVMEIVIGLLELTALRVMLFAE